MQVVPRACGTVWTTIGGAAHWMRGSAAVRCQGARASRLLIAGQMHIDMWAPARLPSCTCSPRSSRRQCGDRGLPANQNADMKGYCFTTDTTVATADIPDLVRM